ANDQHGSDSECAQQHERAPTLSPKTLGAPGTFRGRHCSRSGSIAKAQVWLGNAVEPIPFEAAAAAAQLAQQLIDHRGVRRPRSGKACRCCDVGTRAPVGIVGGAWFRLSIAKPAAAL